jgi:hypothetical protein
VPIAIMGPFFTIIYLISVVVYSSVNIKIINIPLMLGVSMADILGMEVEIPFSSSPSHS